MRFYLKSVLLMLALFVCSVSTTCFAVVDTVQWEQQSHASQVQSIMPSVMALLDYYQENDEDCFTIGAQMIPMDQQPYYQSLYSDNQCRVTLSSRGNAAFSTENNPAVYRFWPVCEMIGDDLELVSWRTVTNADINIAYFANTLENTNGSNLVYSRLANNLDYPFYRMEFHADPLSDGAEPYGYINNCIRVVA